MKKVTDYWVKDKEILIEEQVRTLSGDFVDQLVKHRKEKKLTQQDIADRTGMKRANISRIESKKNIPTLDVLVKYADCLEMRVDVLLRDK